MKQPLIEYVDHTTYLPIQMEEGSDLREENEAADGSDEGDGLEDL